MIDSINHGFLIVDPLDRSMDRCHVATINHGSGGPFTRGALEFQMS